MFASVNGSKRTALAALLLAPTGDRKEADARRRMASRDVAQVTRTPRAKLRRREIPPVLLVRAALGQSSGLPPAALRAILSTAFKIAATWHMTS